jgi:hypothetical protein
VRLCGLRLAARPSLPLDAHDFVTVKLAKRIELSPAASNAPQAADFAALLLFQAAHRFANQFHGDIPSA